MYSFWTSWKTANKAEALPSIHWHDVEPQVSFRTVKTVNCKGGLHYYNFKCMGGKYFNGKDIYKVK